MFERAWVLEQWLERLSKQWEFPPEDIKLLMHYSPGKDETLSLLDEAHRHYGFDVQVIWDYTGNDSAERVWNVNRYAKMVHLRNVLLEEVRRQQPEYYLSCDTDMLLPPETCVKLAQEMGRVGADGISPLTYMTPTGTQFPNCMKRGGVTRELVQPDTFFVGACFGVVLMSPALYSQVDYAVHVNGEDLGWAQNVDNAGLKLALTPHVVVKHVMHPNMLDVVDPRCGF